MLLKSYLQVLSILEKEFPSWNAPILELIAERTHDPYRILISTLLSLRTKDAVTARAQERLFQLADTPEKMRHLPVEDIAQAIFPVGFYKTKAQNIIDISTRIVEEFQGQVPSTMEELLSFQGVGRKTANLVLILGFQIPAICVDTHVHRIHNRLNFVQTHTPEETEFALREKVPVEYWEKINVLFVAFGQTLCKPISPMCSSCPIQDACPRRGVGKHR